MQCPGRGRGCLSGGGRRDDRGSGPRRPGTRSVVSFGDFTMKRKVKDKYLGQILHEDGLEASVAATVEDRAGKFKGAIFEIRSIMDTVS